MTNTGNCCAARKKKIFSIIKTLVNFGQLYLSVQVSWRPERVGADFNNIIGKAQLVTAVTFTVTSVLIFLCLINGTDREQLCWLMATGGGPAVSGPPPATSQRDACLCHPPLHSTVQYRCNIRHQTASRCCSVCSGTVCGGDGLCCCWLALRPAVWPAVNLHTLSHSAQTQYSRFVNRRFDAVQKVPGPIPTVLVLTLCSHYHDQLPV